MTMKTRQLKIYGMQQKQFNEGSLYQYNATSRKTLNRQPNFIPEQSCDRRMELEESSFLTSDYTTKLQSSRQHGTGTKTEI